MMDVEIHLADRPGALADLGEALGKRGVSVEGGGVFTVDGRAVAHFLFEDAAAARAALAAAGIGIAGVHDVVTVRLRQDEPGQLGALARRLGDAGVNLRVQYSDHAGNLILVAGDAAAARAVCDAWCAR